MWITFNFRLGSLRFPTAHGPSLIRTKGCCGLITPEVLFGSSFENADHKGRTGIHAVAGQAGPIYPTAPRAVHLRYPQKHPQSRHSNQGATITLMAAAVPNLPKEKAFW